MNLLALASLILFLTLQNGKVDAKYNFYRFKNCLISEGVGRSSIVERRFSSREYGRLNYQWQLKPKYKRPLAYVLVGNETNVISAVNCARRFRVRLVAKGGGHSLEKFGFGDSKTVVIDVRKLSRVSINEAQMTANIGAGVLIGPMNWKLWKAGKVFIAHGLCGTVGMSGYTTGGGYGFFSRQYGLTLDNVLEMKIVIANGSLLTINKDENSDLFWASRGGAGSSFGIVTDFLFKTYPAPPLMYYGSLKYNISEFQDVFNAWQNEISTIPYSVTGQMLVEKGIIDVQFADSKGTAENFENIVIKFPPSTNRFNQAYTFPQFLLFDAKTLAGEPLNTVLEKPSDLAKLNRKSPKAVYEKRKSFYVNKTINLDKIQDLVKLFAEQPQTTVVRYEHYGGAIADVPNDATAFVHRQGIIYNVDATYEVVDPNPIKNLVGGIWVEKFYSLGKNLFQHTETYQNYVDLELSNYLERYFGTNLPRLVEVKRKYDPKNFFATPQSIPTQI